MRDRGLQGRSGLCSSSRVSRSLCSRCGEHWTRSLDAYSVRTEVPAPPQLKPAYLRARSLPADATDGRWRRHCAPEKLRCARGAKPRKVVTISTPARWRR